MNMVKLTAEKMTFLDLSRRLRTHWTPKIKQLIRRLIWTRTLSRILITLLRHFVRSGFQNQTGLAAWVARIVLPLTRHLEIKKTRAAELSANMTGKPDKTISEWRKQHYENDGVIPESQQGKYLWSGVLWSNEELNKKATRYAIQQMSPSSCTHY